MTTLDTIDLSDHDAFVEAVPHEWFRTLRREDPVHFNPEAGRPGLLGGHPLRTTSARCTATSTSTRRRSAGPRSRTSTPEQIEARKSMIDMDPPRHDELRGLIARRFTPRAVQVWEEAVREVTDARARPRAGAGASSTSSPRSRPRSRCRCSPRSSASRRRSGATSSSSATGCSATRTRSTTSPPDDAHRLLPFSSPAAIEMFEFGRKMAAGAAQAPGQRHRHPARVRAADPARVRRLLRPAGHGRATRRRGTRSPTGCSRCSSTRTSSSGCAATRSSCKPRGRGDAALGDAGAPLPAHRRRATRSSAARDDPRRREGHDLVRLRQPRRDGLRGPGHVRRRPHAEPAHGVRARAASTTAWARTSRGWRSGSRSRSCSRASTTIELAGPPERLRSNFFNGIKRLPVRVTR